MYRCQSCHIVQLPGVPSYMKVLETRPVQYTNQVPDPDDEFGTITKVSSGTEIVRQIVICPACADQPMRIIPDLRDAIRYAKSVAATKARHSQGCKKAIQDCKVCQKDMEWFGELSPMVLNGVIGG